MSATIEPAGAARIQARAGLAPPSVTRSVVLVVALAAGAAGFLATDTGASAQAVAAAGPDLTRLLRAMAGLKTLMAAGATAAVVWRLGSPASSRWLALYAAALAGMAAGPGLIWDMAHVRTGATLLHGGLFATILLLWRDPVVGARLGAAVARRRLLLAGRQ